MKAYPITPDKERERLWYKDDHLDLVVWLEGWNPYGFQLTYHDKVPSGEQMVLQERIIRYFRDKGIKLSVVGSGVAQVSPALKVLQGSADRAPSERLIASLLNNQGDISDFILHFVVAQLRKFAWDQDSNEES